MDLLLLIMLAVLYVTLAGMWVRNVAGKLQPGLKRFSAALPVVMGNLFLPLMCDRSAGVGQRLLNIFVSFLVTWLGTFKVLGYCLDRGPLSEQYRSKGDAWPLHQFIAVLLCPILPKKELPKNGQKSLQKLQEMQSALKRTIVKFAMLMTFSYILTVYNPGSPGKEFLYSYGLMFWLGFSFDLMSLVALGFFGVYSEHSFNHPYLARDLTDFWGRRWNIMTAAVLRPLSYDLIMDGSFVRDRKQGEGKRARPAEWKRAVATLSIFVLSGTIHVVFFWYAAHVFASEWFVFFFIFGPLMILERKAKGILVKVFGDQTHKIPPIIDIPLRYLYSNGLTMFLAGLWFVPPVERVGTRFLAQAVHERVLAILDVKKML